MSAAECDLNTKRKKEIWGMGAWTGSQGRQRVGVGSGEEKLNFFPCPPQALPTMQFLGSPPGLSPGCPLWVSPTLSSVGAANRTVTPGANPLGYSHTKVAAEPSRGNPVCPFRHFPGSKGQEGSCTPLSATPAPPHLYRPAPENPSVPPSLARRRGLLHHADQRRGQASLPHAARLSFSPGSSPHPTHSSMAPTATPMSRPSPPPTHPDVLFFHL